jgi:hypothetical protein
MHILPRDAAVDLLSPLLATTVLQPVVDTASRRHHIQLALLGCDCPRSTLHTQTGCERSLRAQVRAG